jgi:recombination protein RecA
MPSLARVELERLLEARKLGRTLAARDEADQLDERLVASSGMTALDARLGGGWPRGQVSEVVGPSSSGTTWTACAALAAATRRGELAALVDPLDLFDPESAATAGIVWPHLLWVRGEPATTRSGGRPWPLDARSSARARHLAASGEVAVGGRDVRLRDRFCGLAGALAEAVSPAGRGSSSREPRVPSPEPASGQRPAASGEIDRALKALALILQAQGFGLVVLDLHGVPASVVKRIPFTTWRRVQRLVEGRDTACLLVHGEPIGRSAGGVTLALAPPHAGRGVWAGQAARARRFTGLAAQARIIRARWQGELEGFAWTSHV